MTVDMWEGFEEQKLSTYTQTERLPEDLALL